MFLICVIHRCVLLGSLNTHQLSELDEAKPVFGDMVTELKRLVNRHSELAMLPMECIYLNKTALTSVVSAHIYLFDRAIRSCFCLCCIFYVIIVGWTTAESC